MPRPRLWKAGRPMRPAWLFPALIVILATGAILLACMGTCLAADIQPPTDKQAEEWLAKVKSGEYAWVFGESPDDPPYNVVKTEKVTQVEKHDDGTVFVTYHMYVIYTISVKTQYDSAPYTDVYEDHALLDSMTWVAGTDQPLSQSVSDFTDYKTIEVPPDQYGSAMDRAVAAMEASLREELNSFEHVSGWVPVSSGGDITAPPGSESEAEGSKQAGGGSKIPGPGSWWTWLTGTVIAGIIAAIAGFLNSLLGLPPVPAAPPAPPGKPVPPARVPPARGADKPYPQVSIDIPKPRRRPPSGPFDFPPYMEPLPAGVAAGTADPFDLKKHPNQPADLIGSKVDSTMDSLGQSMDEIIEATGESAGQTAKDVGTAVKDGVAGFVHGIASIPGTILEGYVELGKLSYTIYSEYMNGKPSIFTDLISSGEGWEALKGILATLGKELLPTDEISSLFDPNASLEEKLWAIPAAATKLANLIMMAPKLAKMPVPGFSDDLTAISSAKAANKAIEAAKAATTSGAQTEYEAYKAAGKNKASEINKAVEAGGKISKEQVLDAMSDPATMRVIKKAPEAVQKEFAATQAKEIYQPVYDDVVAHMKASDPNGVYKVGGVRTPGQQSLINTDNDVILMKLEKTRDGSLYWKEVPAHQWEGAYFDSFARRTGFDPAKAKARFPEKNWDKMTPMDQKKVWTEGHGQEAMDVKNPEAAQSFSNQPTVMDPRWKPGAKSPVAQGRIVDGEGLAQMEKYKTTRGWKGEGTTVKTQTEAMEQGAKLCNLSKKMASQSMARTGKTIRYPEVFKQGEAILKRSDLAPAVRDQALKNLGFKGGYEEFMDKLSSWTGRLP
ncbi:MAG: hypothetical protein AB1384_14820 [Actinomycetota bacterium]